MKSSDPPLKVKKKVIWVHKGAVQAPHRYAAASNIPGGLVCVCVLVEITSEMKLFCAKLCREPNSSRSYGKPEKLDWAITQEISS
jgi:hypothetical protein